MLDILTPRESLLHNPLSRKKGTCNQFVYIQPCVKSDFDKMHGVIDPGDLRENPQQGKTN